jgi:transglutaminase-like putative cysteine protease
VQFLLLDRLFPRSVFYALRQAESCLEQLDLRPTTRVGSKAEAIWVAIGRDYADVSPVRGTYSGGVATAIEVSVEVTRLA